MVKSANTQQGGRLHMRPLFSRGSSTRSVRSADKKDDSSTRSAEKKDDPVRDVNVAKQRRNRVRFADENARENLSEGALTDKEKKLYYYNEDDLYRFDRDRALTALVYKRGREKGISWDDDKDDSVRGLEEIFLKGETKQDIRRRHAMKVLTTQKQEVLAGRKPDPEILKEVSTKASKECRHKAVALGKEDSVAAGTRHRNFLHYRNAPTTSPIINAANKVKKKLTLWSHQDKDLPRWSH